MVALPALEALGEVDDLLRLAAEVVEDLHRALGDHWRARRESCSSACWLAASRRRDWWQGRTRLALALADGLEHLLDVDLRLGDRLAEFGVDYEPRTSSSAQIQGSSQSNKRRRTEHLIRLPEAERQGVGLHQALVRLGPLLTHAGATLGSRL